MTYSHGYAETDPEFGVFRSICIESASRAFTLNERSASEAMGSTLMESAGYSPEVFLTQGEKEMLRSIQTGAGQVMPLLIRGMAETKAALARVEVEVEAASPTAVSQAGDVVAREMQLQGSAGHRLPRLGDRRR